MTPHRKKCSHVVISMYRVLKQTRGIKSITETMEGGKKFVGVVGLLGRVIKKQQIMETLISQLKDVLSCELYNDLQDSRKMKFLRSYFPQREKMTR